MIVIGERVNATRKSISEAILAHDSEKIKEEIINQDKAGATYIDLNAGTGMGDTDQEISDMKWLIDLALDNTEKPLCIDSPEPRSIKESVEYLNGRRDWMLNSVKKDQAVLDALLPLAAEHDVPIVALAMSEDEIPMEVEKRLDNCKAILEAGNSVGVKPENFYFDSLVMPISSNYKNGRITLDTIKAIKERLPEARTTVGTSNVSFGLPKRALINEAFLVSAMALGLDSAICDPTRKSIKKALTLGRLLNGKDRHCRGYTRTVKAGEFDD